LRYCFKSFARLFLISVSIPCRIALLASFADGSIDTEDLKRRPKCHILQRRMHRVESVHESREGGRLVVSCVISASFRFDGCLVSNRFPVIPAFKT
jgi:hypothetical protein